MVVHKSLGEYTVCGEKADGTYVWRNVTCPVCARTAASASGEKCADMDINSLDAFEYGIVMPRDAELPFTVFYIGSDGMTSWLIKDFSTRMTLPGAFVGDEVLVRSSDGQWMWYKVVEYRPF